MATRAALPTATDSMPWAASNAIRCGVIRSPFSSMRCPSAISPPRRRTNSPASTRSAARSPLRPPRPPPASPPRPRPSGNGAPVKIRTASPGATRKRRSSTRRLFAHHLQALAFLARSRHHRVAVHRGIIERRQREPGLQILRRKTIERLGQRDLPRCGKGRTRSRIFCNASSCEITPHSISRARAALAFSLAAAPRQPRSVLLVRRRRRASRPDG